MKNKKTKIKRTFVAILSCTVLTTAFATPAQAASQEKTQKVSEGGKLVSNSWRSTFPTASGNTYQWDYQVSAKYTGTAKVKEIKTTWRASASLRNSANISLGVSGSGVNAGGGSGWQTVTTCKKYWKNTNGSKESSYRSNIIVTPKTDYRTGTVSIINDAYLKVKGNKKPYRISSGV